MLQRTPDFEHNMLKVLRGERPERGTLFELFLSEKYLRLLAKTKFSENTVLTRMRTAIEAMATAGYDYATCHAANFGFKGPGAQKKETMSLNHPPCIYDWESFEAYPWPDMSACDYSRLEEIAPFLPEGMKLMVMGPGGVLETVISIVGYENLCFLLQDDPQLTKEIFDNVGSRFVEYYDNAASADTVGFVSSNDDWGFNTQTFLSPEDMRRYLFPWHKKIVETVHKHNKPCLLHSCGYYDEIIEDIIKDMHYDARHSYEDNITPVEQAYEDLNGRIAVLGGIDIHYLATKTPQEIYNRCSSMLERSRQRGGYALGSGNSIADFIPTENYLAMIRAAHDFNP